MKFTYKDSALLGEDELVKFNDQLEGYQDILIQAKNDKEFLLKEASLFLPFDDVLLQKCNKIKEDKCTSSLKYVVVVGIGGSNLGTKAVYDTKFGHFDKYQPNRAPRMIFADTNDSSELHEINMLLSSDVHDVSEILINVITKSGTTTETIANSEIIIAPFRNKFGDSINDRIIVITGEESPLLEESNKHEMTSITIPNMVGGRFSVFSAVGLLPLLCAGFDIEAFRMGAQEVLDSISSDNEIENSAFISASALYKHYIGGKNIHNTFIFHPECESLGKWYRQLLGESVGKEKNLKDEVVNIGIVPTVSLGSTDLHSVGQLYLGGPNNRVTTFVSAESVLNEVQMPESRLFPNIVPNISDKKLTQISNAILEGVKSTYQSHDMPFMSVELQNLTVKELGAFLQFKMLEVMYLGRLLGVDVFNQPNVESYKEEIRKNLI